MLNGSSMPITQSHIFSSLRSEPTLSKQSAAQLLRFYYWALIPEFIAIDKSWPQTQINKPHRKKKAPQWSMALLKWMWQWRESSGPIDAFCLFSRMKSFVSLPARIIIWVYDLSGFNESQVMNPNPHDGKQIPALTTELALLPWRFSWQRQQREQLMHAAVW